MSRWLRIGVITSSLLLGLLLTIAWARSSSRPLVVCEARDGVYREVRCQDGKWSIAKMNAWPHDQRRDWGFVARPEMDPRYRAVPIATMLDGTNWYLAAAVSQRWWPIVQRTGTAVNYRLPLTPRTNPYLSGQPLRPGPFSVMTPSATAPTNAPATPSIARPSPSSAPAVAPTTASILAGGRLVLTGGGATVTLGATPPTTALMSPRSAPAEAAPSLVLPSASGFSAPPQPKPPISRGLLSPGTFSLQASAPPGDSFGLSLQRDAELSIRAPSGDLKSSTAPPSALTPGLTPPSTSVYPSKYLPPPAASPPPPPPPPFRRNSTLTLATPAHTFEQWIIPAWAITALALLPAALLLGATTTRGIRRRRRRKAGRCESCGYDLRGNPHSPVCPECGREMQNAEHESTPICTNEHE
jgi:hypothetical protein